MFVVVVLCGLDKFNCKVLCYLFVCLFVVCQ